MKNIPAPAPVFRLYLFLFDFTIVCIFANKDGHYSRYVLRITTPHKATVIYLLVCFGDSKQTQWEHGELGNSSCRQPTPGLPLSLPTDFDIDSSSHFLSERGQTHRHRPTDKATLATGHRSRRGQRQTASGLRRWMHDTIYTFIAGNGWTIAPSVWLKSPGLRSHRAASVRFVFCNTTTTYLSTTVRRFVCLVLCQKAPDSATKLHLALPAGP